MSKVAEIVKSLKECKAAIDASTTEKARLEAALMVEFQEEVQAQLASKDYGTGTANVEKDGCKIKVVISKKVSYDQEGLKGFAATLSQRGEDPDDYMVIKYNVAEGAYKNWPSSLQKMVEPFRTVEPSKPTITIEE